MDLDQSRRAVFTETAAHDYPVTKLVAQAMEAGALCKSDPVLSSSQLLALVKNFYNWPKCFLGQQNRGV
ncbi:TetR/AcrR family transcriptional regulator C-terminal domain-containing protein [Sulfitobacter sp. 1A13191]|uniref:TetR/AcrR family transcriptional regulator C-terminal domain-containing protein n=1 Tax=Sulfitobacter sp. 1A13191 TaxID=3368589 RepID=UPI0037477F2D